MTFLPIVDRELRVGSRAAGTYWVRVIAGLAVLVMLSLMYWQWTNSGIRQSAGSMAFTALSMLAMFYCLFEGARSTADAISEEKREGTLGLLFLTDLSGYDVVFGKLAACSLNSFYGLLAIFPVIAICLLMGGVTGAEFWRVILVLANTLFFSLAAGMWVSARHELAHSAAKGTIGFMILVAGVPVLLDQLISRTGSSNTLFSILSPGYACLMGHDAYYRTSPWRFWVSIATTQAFAWFLLLHAGRRLLTRWRDVRTNSETVVAPSFFRLAGGSDQRRRVRERVLERHPFAWVARADGAPDMLLILIGVLAAAGAVWLERAPATAKTLWIAGFAGSAVAVLILRLLAASRASRCFLESRESGAFEILLTTPLPPREIVRGQRIAIRKFLFWIVLVDLLVALLAYQAQAAQIKTMAAATGGMNHELLIYFAFNAIANAVVFAADVFALSWVAMWLALHVRGHNRLVAKAFLYVIIIPWLLGFVLQMRGVTISGFPWLQWSKIPALLIIKDLIFIRWARQKLKNELHSVLSEGKGRFQFGKEKAAVFGGNSAQMADNAG